MQYCTCLKIAAYSLLRVIVQCFRSLLLFDEGDLFAVCEVIVGNLLL